MSRLGNYLGRIILGSTGLIFLIVLLTSIFVKNGNPFSISSHNQLLIIALAAVLIILVYMCYKLIINTTVNISKKKELFILAGFMLSLVLCQLFVGAILAVDANAPTWDLWEIHLSATQLADTGQLLGGEHFYLSSFPFNILTVELLSTVLKMSTALGITHIASPQTVFILLNILFINVAIVLMYLCVRKIFGIKVALFSLVLTVLFSPFILYSPIYYTDTLSMPFITGAFYLFINIIDTHRKKWHKIVLSGILGVVVFIGMNIKFTVIILVIAMLIYMLLNFQKALLKPAILCTLVFGLSLGSLQLVWNMHTSGLVDQNLKVPITHWVMMGLKGTGGWNGPDFSRITFPAIKNGKDVVAIHKQQMIKRLHDYGIGGYIHFLMSKISYVWGDGTYYVSEKLNRAPQNPDSILFALFAKDGKSSIYYIYFSGALQVAFLILYIVSAYALFRGHGDDRTIIIYLSIFGLFLFLLLWEARSRYLVNYMPLFIISITGAFNNIISLKRDLFKNRSL